MTESWPTAITQIEPNHVRVRGYDIAELMGNEGFGAAVHLILTGELPGAKIGRLMDAVLVASIDHGVTPPSVLAARTVASTGAPLSASVAAGISAINRHHGGAIQACAEALGRVVERAGMGKPPEEAATEVIAEMRAQGRRFPGFGHRIHTDDPRTARLFALADEAGVTREGEITHVHAARAVEAAFRNGGKALPINVDGAIAAVLADLGFDPPAMNGLFMIARSAGLVAHVTEEQKRMRPMRRIDPSSHEYDGPPARKV